MEFVSKMITAAIDALLAPIGAARHALGLAWLSLLTGVAMALVFKLASNGERIRTAKDLSKSFILEMRIYRDDARAILAAFFGALRANLAYLRLVLPPFLVIVVPAAVIFMQLDERYARRHIPEGSTTILSVTLVEGADVFAASPSLACDSGVSIEAGPVRIGRKREVSWRLAVGAPGTHVVRISTGGREYAVPVVAEEAHRMIGSSRSARTLIEPFLHPALPPIPGDSPIESVRILYPDARYPLLFWRVHWIVAFLFYSLVGAAAVKLLVGFEI